jgi:hypothetical protein
MVQTSLTIVMASDKQSKLFRKFVTAPLTEKRKWDEITIPTEMNMVAVLRRVVTAILGGLEISEMKRQTGDLPGLGF